MNLKDLADLISIRNYVYQNSESMTLPKSTINELGKVKILLDKKINSIVLGEEFKKFVEYENADKAVKEIIDVVNIKSSFNKK